MHKSVLLEESIDLLDIHDGETVVDGTFGGGGHSRHILEQHPDIFLICVDLDEQAQTRFDAVFAQDRRTTFVHANFKDAAQILAAAEKKSVDKVLLDLGTSTFQLLADTRGFSFHSDMPLQMTFSEAGSHTGFTARDIVNSWEESSIADIIYYYGDEHKARTIAKAIVGARQKKSIDTAVELAAIIESIVPRHSKTHPATKTFQALRIAVNDELKVIQEALDNWWKVLIPGGRIALITFHSLEDRTVKHWMQSKENHTNKRVITKKPIAPTRTELQANPRSRSAKLRVVEKIENSHDGNN